VAQGIGSEFKPQYCKKKKTLITELPYDPLIPLLKDIPEGM
jgi:hypothetical protein